MILFHTNHVEIISLNFFIRLICLIFDIFIDHSTTKRQQIIRQVAIEWAKNMSNRPPSVAYSVANKLWLFQSNELITYIELYTLSGR